METQNIYQLYAHESWADLFNLLAISLRLPTEELADGVESGAFKEDVQSLFEELDLFSEDIECWEGVSCEDTCGLKSELRRSYTELFTHPSCPQIAITESRFRDVREKAKNPTTPFLNDAALHAEECYRRAGLKLSADVSREPADHIAMELEFLAFVHTQCAAALAREDAEELTIWERRLGEFRPHMNAWAVDFFVACRDSRCGDFYPWVGKWAQVAMNAYLA